MSGTRLLFSGTQETADLPLDFVDDVVIDCSGVFKVVVSAPVKDLRRAQSALNSRNPTTTGSATAITLICPELKGCLNGIVRDLALLEKRVDVDRWCFNDMDSVGGRPGGLDLAPANETKQVTA